MILTRFPDLKWLKQQTEQAFLFKKKGIGGKGFPYGWPNVIMNAKVFTAERPEIRGPLSLFTNVSGNSFATAGKRRLKVDHHSFFLSNEDQEYSLEINSNKKVETLNIHFGNQFLETLFIACSNSTAALLEGAVTEPEQICFRNMLYRRSPELDQLLVKLKTAGSAMEEEELLAEVAYFLLRELRDLNGRIGKIPSVKKSVREEAVRRVCLATDIIQMEPFAEHSLEELSAISALSKFHFLRLFKTIHACTPHQYIISVRMQKAAGLLEKGKFNIGEVALLSGYKEPASFTRVFLKTFKVTPTRYMQMGRK